MSFAALILEQFADAPLFGDGGREKTIDPQAAYLEGFAAGEATALARLAEAERAFIDAAHSIDDAIKAIRPASEQALAEALEIVLTALLPTLSSRGFAAEASAAVARAFAGGSEAKVTIFANPVQVEALAAAMSAVNGAAAFEIEADDAAPAASARIICGRGGLDFNLDAAAEACLAALASACSALKNGN